MNQRCIGYASKLSVGQLIGRLDCTLQEILEMQYDLPCNAQMGILICGIWRINKEIKLRLITLTVELFIQTQ